MREIKFRDYTPEENKLRYFDIDGYDREEHGKWGEVMQYTGLKDKNGKEIYEGDILKKKCGMVSNGPNHSMVHDFRYEEVKFNDIYGDDYTTIIGGFSINDDCYQEYEVCGNVYENPELLTNNTNHA